MECFAWTQLLCLKLKTIVPAVVKPLPLGCRPVLHRSMLTISSFRQLSSTFAVKSEGRRLDA